MYIGKDQSMLLRGLSDVPLIVKLEFLLWTTLQTSSSTLVFVWEFTHSTKSATSVSHPQCTGSIYLLGVNNVKIGENR